jgi:hypothetical protein
MAFKAFGRLGFCIGEFFAENEDAHASLTAFLHMSRSRAMTGLAAFLAGGAAGNAFFGVSGDHVGIEVILMAALADLCSHGSIAPSRFLRRQTSAEEEQHGNDGKNENGFPHHIPLV